MFRRKTTITRADLDRLLQVTREDAHAVSWAWFVDELRREIANARVVDPARVRLPSDLVTMHSTVRIRDLAPDREPEVYTLVYPHEADVAAGRLSVLATLGTALLGVRAGAVVRVACASGIRAIRVEGVLHQPEAAGSTGSPRPRRSRRLRPRERTSRSRGRCRARRVVASPPRIGMRRRRTAWQACAAVAGVGRRVRPRRPRSIQ